MIAGGAKRVWLQMTVGKQFTQMDTNGDGKLTRDEVPMSSAFDAWDREQYGIVTSEQFASSATLNLVLASGLAVQQALEGRTPRNFAIAR